MSKKNELTEQNKNNEEIKNGEIKNDKQKKRKFRAIFIDPNGEVVMEGRHKGSKPQQAACKALTGIYDIFAEEGKIIEGEVRFGLSETTRGSLRKNFWYVGKKTETNPTNLYVLPINEISESDEKKNKKHINLYILPNNEENNNIKEKYLLEKNKKNRDYFTAKEIIEMGGFEKIFNNKEENIKPLKKYFTAKDINEIGGFEKIFGEKEENVKPNITYKKKPCVKKSDTKESLELFNSKNKDERIANTLLCNDFNKKGYKKTTMKKTKFDI
jgi:hypothetical protein